MMKVETKIIDVSKRYRVINEITLATGEKRFKVLEETLTADGDIVALKVMIKTGEELNNSSSVTQTLTTKTKSDAHQGDSSLVSRDSSVNKPMKRKLCDHDEPYRSFKRNNTGQDEDCAFLGFVPATTRFVTKQDINFGPGVFVNMPNKSSSVTQAITTRTKSDAHQGDSSLVSRDSSVNKPMKRKLSDHDEPCRSFKRNNTGQDEDCAFLGFVPATTRFVTMPDMNVGPGVFVNMPNAAYYSASHRMSTTFPTAGATIGRPMVMDPLEASVPFLYTSTSWFSASSFYNGAFSHAHHWARRVAVQSLQMLENHCHCGRCRYSCHL